MPLYDKNDNVICPKCGAANWRGDHRKFCKECLADLLGFTEEERKQYDRQQEEAREEARRRRDEAEKAEEERFRRIVYW